jgi:hypothetical protein
MSPKESRLGHGVQGRMQSDERRPRVLCEILTVTGGGVSRPAHEQVPALCHSRCGLERGRRNAEPAEQRQLKSADLAEGRFPRAIFDVHLASRHKLGAWQSGSSGAVECA